MPNTGVPLCSSAISVPQIGKPAMKDLVPSIGSSTQTYSASSRSLPNSSPTMPCWGKLALIRRRITASAARSASVTGSKSLALLLSIESEVRKNGRMVSPDAVARRPMKAVKSMTVTAVPYRQWRKNAASCLAQSAPSRTANGALFPFVIDDIWLSNRLSNRLRLSVDFWLVPPSRSCEFWHTSTAARPGLDRISHVSILKLLTVNRHVSTVLPICQPVPLCSRK